MAGDSADWFPRSWQAMMPAWPNPVRCSVIGCGAVTRQYYAPALRMLIDQRWVERVRFVDPVEAAAQQAARLVGRGAMASEWRAAVESDDELAIVASPPSTHAQQAIALLSAGKHILCEKPFALETTEAHQVATLAGQLGRHCAVGMVRRFAPTACWLKQLAADRLDPWKRLEWSEGEPFRWPVTNLDYFRPSAGNGLLWDIGAHVIDLLVWWLGEPVELRCWDDAMGGVEANARLELRFDGGCQATVRLSRDTPIARRILISRRADELRCADAIDGPVEWRRREAPLALQGIVGPTAQTRSSSGLGDRADFAGCFVAQLKNVLDAVRGGDRPWVQAADVLAGLRTLERAVAETQLLELPWLSEEERGQALRLRAARTPVVVES